MVHTVSHVTVHDADRDMKCQSVYIRHSGYAHRNDDLGRFLARACALRRPVNLGDRRVYHLSSCPEQSYSAHPHRQRHLPSNQLKSELGAAGLPVTA